MKKKNILLIIILITVQLAFLCYFGCEKKGMHFDELFSYFNTNNSVGRQVYDGTYLEREDITKDFYVKDGEEFNYSYVVTLQGYDVHPPVYYLILHTICSFTKGVFSYWQGLFANILFLSVAIVFIFLSLYEITGNSVVSFVISMFVGINTGNISNGMFIRMYALLTMWIAINIYLHIRMSKAEDLSKLSWKYIILNGALAYVGFLTHYFYLVFLFLIEASFWIPKLFKIKQYYKTIIKYALSILIFGLLGVLSFPQCLGHVNSGYRGVEVKSNMFDLSDFGDRISFFGGLLDKFVFGKCLYLYLLLALLLLITSYCLSKKNKAKFENLSVFVQTILIPTVGYFLISAKASLIGEEAMIRYQLPIYGLIIVCVAIIIYECCLLIFKNVKVKKTVIGIIAFSFLVISIISLYKGNVFYLYPEQDEMKRIAKENAGKECVYIYNNDNNKYFLWNDAEQLWQFDEIYFVDSDNMTPIDETKICNSKDLIVYISTLNKKEDFGEYESLIYNSNNNLHSYSKLYDGVYCECYEFK